MVGLQIQHWALRNNGVYNVPFRRRSELTPERILAILEKLFQSAEEFEIDDDLEIAVTRIPQIRGGRPAEHTWRHRDFMKKHCHAFIRIHNPDDDLCFARAVIVAKARIDKETNPEIARKWNQIRRGDRGRRLQKNMAQELMLHSGLGDHTGIFSNRVYSLLSCLAFTEIYSLFHLFRIF